MGGVIISSINKGKQMKARLAKKLAHTPIDRLAPKWLMRIARGDARLAKALSKWEKIPVNN